MPRSKDKWYHNIIEFPSKEELDQRYEEILRKIRERANAKRFAKISGMKDERRED